MSFVEIASLLGIASASTVVVELVRRLLEKTRERKPSAAAEILKKSLAERGIKETAVAELLASLTDSEKNDKVAAPVRLSGSIEMVATGLIEDRDDSEYLARRFLPVTSAFDELYRRRVVDKNTLEAFQEFWSIRNKLIHGRGVSGKELDDALYLGTGILMSLLTKTRVE